MSTATSDAHKDAQVVKALFAALCTSIPEDARLELLRNSSLELKFLTAVQPRVSGFSHRRRHSLRHPAMSMAVQRFYWTRRRQRLEEEAEALEQQQQQQQQVRRNSSDDEAERINAMLAGYANRGDAATARDGSFSSSAATPEDGGWAGFGTSVSDSLWHYRRMSSANGMDADRGTGVPGYGPRLSSAGFAAARRESGMRRVSALSGSLASVVRNTGSFAHLLEFPGSTTDSARRASFAGGAASPSKKSSSANESNTNASSFFFGKHRQPQQQQQQQQQLAAPGQGRAVSGKSGGAIMPTLGMTADAYTTTTVLGADDMEEEEEFVAFQQGEDLRWEHIATCYDQMLRAASAPCKLAALAAAMNSMLNDVIRRFWDRMTVPPAAYARYERRVYGHDAKAQDEGAEDEAQDLDVAAQDGFDHDGDNDANSDAAPATTGGEEHSPGNGEGGGSGSDPAPGKSSALGRKGPKAAAGNAKGRRGVRTDTSGRPKARKGKETSKAKGSAAAITKKKPNKSGGAAAGEGGGGGGTALYMSPLQYVYLHMRIAAVLLPPGNDLEIEMLESVREDLLMDGAYREDDLQLEHYFGKAPVLVVPPGVVPPMDPNPPEDRLMRPSGGLHHALRGTGYGPGADRGVHRPYRWSSAMVGGESVVATGTVVARGDDVGSDDPWDTVRMPWLTYAQFWNAMMELADNWTCSAANPVEYATFLFELYGDVFGHDWGEEDRAYLDALKRKRAQQQGADADRMQESLDVLASFQEMLEDLEDMSGSESEVFMEKHFGRHDSQAALLQSPIRRRSTKRFSHGGGGEADDFDDDGDSNITSSNSSIDWTGRHKKDGWRYRRFLDEHTGKWKRHRRKTVLERSKRAKKAAAGAVNEGGEAPASTATQQQRADGDSGQSSNEAGLDSGSSEYSIYILEEELDSDNEVIYRRRLHRHDTNRDDAQGDRGGRRRRHRRKRRSFDSDDKFMYDDDDGDGLGGRGYLRRKYYDKPASRFRRLDNGLRKDDYLDTFYDDLSAETSWSSFTDHDEARETEGWQPFRPLQTVMERQPRLRKRVRRTGPRSQMRRYGREPTYYYRDGFGDDDDEESGLSSLDDSAAFSIFSYSVDEEEDLRPLRDSAEELSREQRAHLLDRKPWLQRVLAAKGVHISDATFADRDEEALLYQLLLMTERLAAQAAAAGGSSFEDADDIGIADFDTALLARLFAKPQSYTLEELQQSDLMKRLLAMNDDGEGRVPLTAAQMDGVLAALMAGKRPGGPVETVSARRRRENMIAEARRLQKALLEEEQRRLAAEKAERRRMRAAGSPVGAADTFGLTEALVTDGSRPVTGERRHRPSRVEQRPGIGDDIDDAKLMVRVQPHGLTPTPPSLAARPLTASSLQHQPTSSGTGEDASLPPVLTRQERREQEALFREFEAYCIEQAERTSKYRIRFTEYTPQQLEAFFLHLNLGTRQRALLCGRAPLAPPTSSVGGNLHQVRGAGRHEVFVLGNGGGAAITSTRGDAATDGTGGDVPAVTYAPAPVKVFTLTTADTLESAIRESYHSYVDDRGFQASFANARHNAVANGSGSRSGKWGRPHPSTNQGREAASEGQTILPPLPATGKASDASTTRVGLPPLRPTAPRSDEADPKRHRPLSTTTTTTATASTKARGVAAASTTAAADAVAVSPSSPTQLPSTTAAAAAAAAASPAAGRTDDEVVTPAVILQRTMAALDLSEGVDMARAALGGVVASPPPPRGGKGLALATPSSSHATTTTGVRKKGKGIALASRKADRLPAGSPPRHTQGGGPPVLAPSPKTPAQPTTTKRRKDGSGSLSTTSSRGFGEGEVDD